MENQSTSASRSPVFPLPFTREQLRIDIQNIVLLEMRKLRHMSAEDAPLPMLDPVHSFQFWDAGCTPDEIGITYEQASKFAIAPVCEDYFDYGFYAVTGTRSDDFKWDSIHTWIAAYLVDLFKSNYVAEWDPGEGHKGLQDGIKRCLYLCELANARLILEGKEDFYHFSYAGKDEDGRIGDLSIRQLAMLSGMEEMSLRSYISRKTAPILEISKNDRRTYITSEVAKQWLIDKGRYLPVQTGRISAELDLSTSKFSSFDEFTSMLCDRLAFIGEKSQDRAALTDAVTTALRACRIDDLYGLNHEHIKNSGLMEQLATLLELPANLLKLRAREAALKSEISNCQWQLNQLQQQSAS
ncbi:hypothetical protein [Rhodoferax sp. PAMC 29310]|uniref:hypothetical protein n=1 Tax=Rhodoferax sp. PAMC 29310 TaxID=2822760 RepID=UPI001B32BA62|nr:hypothetical protein [Rhodoferax sp. PAMC 29310]